MLELTLTSHQRGLVSLSDSERSKFLGFHHDRAIQSWHLFLSDLGVFSFSSILSLPCHLYTIKET